MIVRHYDIEARSGSGTARLAFRDARGARALACWMVVPSAHAPDEAPLVAVHGIRRGAREMAEGLFRRAEALGRIVVAPVFDETRWPSYQQVVRKGRADLALLELLGDLRSEGLWSGGRLELLGHSGGAQFAHRFAMLYPHRIGRLTVGSAGWYTFPDATRFPLGLGPRQSCAEDWGARMSANLSAFLRLPMQIYIGEHDDRPDPNTRRGPQIDAHQGIDRRTRAERWAIALRSTAAARGIEPCISLTVLSGAGHEFEECIRNPALVDLALPVPMRTRSHSARASA